MQDVDLRCKIRYCQLNPLEIRKDLRRVIHHPLYGKSFASHVAKLAVRVGRAHERRWAGSASNHTRGDELTPKDDSQILAGHEIDGRLGSDPVEVEHESP